MAEQALESSATAATLEVVSPGALATLQDLGRPGWRRFGVPRAGALDPQLLRIANRLAGNAEGAAAIEFFAAGPTLKAVDAPGATRPGRRLPVDADARQRRAHPARLLAQRDAAARAIRCAPGSRVRRAWAMSPCAGSRCRRCSAAPRPTPVPRSAVTPGARWPRATSSAPRLKPAARPVERVLRRPPGATGCADPRRARSAGRLLQRRGARCLLRRRVPRLGRGRPHGRAPARPGAGAPQRQGRGDRLRRHRAGLDPGARQRPADRAAGRWPDGRRLPEDRHRDVGRPGRGWRPRRSAPNCASRR